MHLLLYTVAVLGLGAGLVVFSYLDRIYRELGRVTTGRTHANLDVFEAEIDPRLRMDRRQGNLTFSLLSHFWLVVVAVATARGVSFFVPGTLESLIEQLFLLAAEVSLGMHFIPYLLLTRTSSRWLVPLAPVIRAFVWIVWPLRMGLEVAISVAHLSEEEEPGAQQVQQDGIEALVEAAEEEGILEREEAHLRDS